MMIYLSNSVFPANEARPRVEDNDFNCEETPSRAPKRSVRSEGNTELVDLNIGVIKNAPIAETTTPMRIEAKKTLRQRARRFNNISIVEECSTVFTSTILLSFLSFILISSCLL